MADNDTDLIEALGALSSEPPGDALMQRIAADAVLEQAFARARNHPPRPSDLLMARIARDARRHRPRRWFDAAAWGGMVAAGIVGLTIGTGGLPMAIPDLTTAEADYDLVPSYDFQLLAEE